MPNRFIDHTVCGGMWVEEHIKERLFEIVNYNYYNIGISKYFVGTILCFMKCIIWIFE